MASSSSSEVSAVYSDRMATAIRRGITSVVIIIASLTFAFSFGNGLVLGIQLGVPRWIAVMVTPAVDLSTLALIIAIQHVRAHGVATRMLGPRALLIGSGLTTFVINVAKAAVERHYGRAAYDAVSPLLLIGWSEVGPRLLALLHNTAPGARSDAVAARDVQDDYVPLVLAVPDESGPSAQLVARAHEAAAAHRATTGRAISRDVLRAQLRVSNAVAGELVRIVRTSSPNGGAP